MHLSEETRFAGLVLGYFVHGMLSAVLAFAIGSTGLWDVNWQVRIGAPIEDIPMVMNADDRGPSGSAGVCRCCDCRWPSYPIKP